MASKRLTKGKQHPAHAQSLVLIGRALKKRAKIMREVAKYTTLPPAGKSERRATATALTTVGVELIAEGQRLRRILR